VPADRGTAGRCVHGGILYGRGFSRVPRPGQGLSAGPAWARLGRSVPRRGEGGAACARGTSAGHCGPPLLSAADILAIIWS